MIGRGLLPGDDFVKLGSDSLQIHSYTMYDSIFATDNPQYCYLGQLSDPFFGITKTEFVSQVRLNQEWSGGNYVVDSVKLILHILSVTGGADGSHMLKISEIADQLYNDTAYYSNEPVNIIPASEDGGVELNLELPVLKLDTVNDFEFVVPKSFGERIMRDSSKLFYSNTRADFRSYFKGLYFQLSSIGDPTFLSLTLVNNGTGYYNFFAIFLHDNQGTKKTLYLILDAKNANAAYNRFDHEIAIPHYNDLENLDSLTYIQGLNGVYTRLRLPGLERLKNDPSLGSKISINKAKLTLPVHTDAMHKIGDAPTQLYLRYNTSGGSKYIIPDWSVDTDHNFFGGKIDTVNNVYNFNIATYVQRYLEDTKGEMKPELELFQSASTKNVILKANQSTKPVKLDLVYTFLDQ